MTANLVILGFAAGKGAFFCHGDLLEKIIRDKSPEHFRDGNLKAFRTGSQAASPA